MKHPKAQERIVSQPFSHPGQDGNGDKATAPAVADALVAPVCRTNLLKDIPASEDAFSDPKLKVVGPHQTVADVIAGMIREPDAEGVSIGLEGTWGSGKTTVVKLLCEDLKGDPDIRLIQFDAWAHEGDPLRRTFLETLIHHLKKYRWVSTHKWDAQLEKLANRKEVTTVKDTPKVTGWGTTVALLLLLIPLGGALFGQAVREPVTFANTGTIAWKFIFELTFGLVLSFAPFLILLSRKVRKSGVLELIINRGVTEKRTETDKTPNATSIEFEDYFKRLMHDALSKHSERRLVLVLDNLDRVDSKDALSIWSTLQTFMQHKRDEDSPWYTRLWTLVLYDPKALSKLWKEKESDGDVAAREAAPSNAAGKPEEKNQQEEAPGTMGEIAASFIDKSFQIRFEVSPPVPSNWYSFLLEQLTKAFPGHVDEETQFHAVYRVLSIDRVLSKQPPPTIRELKLYINQIGALHRQLALRGKCKGPDSFPLSLMAYYVLLRRRRPNVDIANCVLRNELPEIDFEGLLGDKVGDRLAAIHYNVDVSLARQVILGPPIKMALQEGKKDELIGYAENPKAFWKVLDDIIDEWIPGESIGILKTAYSLDDMRLLGSADARSINRVRGKLRDAALKITLWLPLDEVRVNGITSLFNIVKESEFAETILELVTTELASPEGSTTSQDKSIQGWVETLLPMFDKINELDWAGLYEQKVIETLCQKLRAEVHTFPESHLQRALEMLWDLRQAKSVSPANSDIARRSLSELVSEGHVSKHIVVLEMTNHTLAWILFVVANEDPKAAIPMMSKAPETGSYEPIVQVEDVPNRVSVSFTNILARYDEWGLLFEMLDADAAYHPLVMKSLEAATNIGYRNLTISPAEFLKHWRLLQQELDKDGTPSVFDKLLSQMVEKTTLVPEITNQDFAPELAKLYVKIYPLTKENYSFWDDIILELRELGTDEWGKHLWQEGELLELVNLLAAEGMQFSDDSHYREALLRYARGILNERVRPTHAWNNLVDALDEKGSRAEFRVSLDETFASYLQLDADVPPVFFDIFGSELVDAYPNKSSAALPSLFLSLLKKRETRGLEWMAKMLETYPLILENSPSPGEAESFKDAIYHAMSEETDANTASILSRIADSMNILSVDFIASAYERIIKELAERGRKVGLSSSLLDVMRSELTFFTIPDETSSFLSNDAKEIYSEKGEHIRALQNTLSILKNLPVKEPERAMLDERLRAILNDYYDKEYWKGLSLRHSKAEQTDPEGGTPSGEDL